MIDGVATARGLAPRDNLAGEAMKHFQPSFWELLTTQPIGEGYDAALCSPLAGP